MILHSIEPKIRPRWRVRIRSVTVVTARPVTATRPVRRRSSRATIGFGVFVFLVATVGLSEVIETAKPEWRDPEFGHRLTELKKWKADAPLRPVTLLIGTSRVQMGFSPDAMDFPNEPGSPLVYNCGYRGATPLWCCMQAMRWLDSEIKPKAIVFSFSYWEMLAAEPAEALYAKWASRLSAQDLDRLAPYCNDRELLTEPWKRSRLRPWESRREVFGCAWFSELQPAAAQHDCRFATSWKVMDRYGFSAWPLPDSEEERQRFLASNKTVVKPLMAGIPIGEFSDRGVRDLVLRCQREGIAIAGVCSPESPTYRSWYSQKGRDVFDQYTRKFSAEMGIPMFPAPDDYLVDKDFADGYHLNGTGAKKYSRWLAETHLKRWLALNVAQGN